MMSSSNVKVMGTGQPGLNGRLLEVAVVVGMDEETGLEHRPIGVSLP